jgi:hypothetical protein
VEAMNQQVQRLINGLVGEPCSRKEVGEHRSLSLGFGPEARPANARARRAYRVWELGTYSCDWRIVAGSVVLCGSRDSAAELNHALDNIELGRLTSIRKLNDFDLRIEFHNGISVDFLATFSDDDECFHIFCPGNVCAAFTLRDGWKIGPCDQPWE